MSAMERLRDVLNGTWTGSYGYEGRGQNHRTDTRFELSSQISSSTGNLEVTGKGSDFTGNFRFEGAATSPNEIAMTKLIGPANNWWHKATVNLDKKEMQGNWGGAWYPDKVDGSLVFQRQMTQEEKQREAEDAKRSEENTRREQEKEAAASAAQKKQQEEAATAAAKQKGEEEAARKKQEREKEEAARKQEQENKEAAKKLTEEAEAARKRAEETGATKERADGPAKKVRNEREKPDSIQQKQSGKASPERIDATQNALKSQQAVQKTSKANEKPDVSTADSEDGVAGKLKVYLKLDLEVDITVIATLRGDVAIGIL